MRVYTLREVTHKLCIRYSSISPAPHTRLIFKVRAAEKKKKKKKKLSARISRVFSIFARGVFARKGKRSGSNRRSAASGGASRFISKHNLARFVITLATSARVRSERIADNQTWAWLSQAGCRYQSRPESSIITRAELLHLSPGSQSSSCVMTSTASPLLPLSSWHEISPRLSHTPFIVSVTLAANNCFVSQLVQPSSISAEKTPEKTGLMHASQFPTISFTLPLPVPLSTWSAHFPPTTRARHA